MLARDGRRSLLPFVLEGLVSRLGRRRPKRGSETRRRRMERRAAAGGETGRVGRRQAAPGPISHSAGPDCGRRSVGFWRLS